jgi:predicted dehydrogenase
MLRKRFTRRTFLGGLAAASVPWVVPSSVLGASAPSGRVAVGCIGVGGRGTGNMQTFLHTSQVVAVCDPNDARSAAAKAAAEEHYAAQRAKGSYKGCSTYRDFRDLVAREDIDAVSICTPDHWHVPLALAAAKSGKDVFVEKPLSLTIAEGRALVNAVKRYGRVFQHGTQRRSEGGFRHACELVRNGRIGQLKCVRVTSEPSHECPVQPPMPVPKGFDYDLWLGPAPWTPYTERRVHTPFWYWIADYTIGFVAGQGVHFTDIAQWGIDADATGPVEIAGSGTFPKDGLCDTATGWHVEMAFANGLKLVYTDDRQAPMGVYFEGTEGSVFALCSGISTSPKSLLGSAIGPNEIQLYRSRGHVPDFVERVRTRGETAAPVEAAHRATSLCHLTHLAILTGRKLQWDPVKEEFLNDPDANRLLSKHMREPWRL